MARCEKQTLKNRGRIVSLFYHGDVATGEHGSLFNGGKRRDKMSVRNIRLTQLVSRPYILNVANVREN